jgi:mannitol/fructose-specific phosphotransferase system IIA component
MDVAVVALRSQHRVGKQYIKDLYERDSTQATTIGTVVNQAARRLAYRT